MAIRQIVKEGDSVLTKKCREVVKFDDRLAQLIDDMIETLHESGGVGLAAPQVGVIRRVVVIDISQEQNQVIELVNPVIIETEGEQESVEGCLSCPGEWGITVRPNYVKVKAFDRHGNEFTVDGKELLAKAFCHELDHLDGIIFKQVAKRMLTKEECEEMFG
ncbi:peptide deformylase [Ruminococcus sp.]|uniref:peptide deformylase n=1 Tax=Ruminococcus sp. TaxID=41978 RepID=UPI0038649AF2